LAEQERLDLAYTSAFDAMIVGSGTIPGAEFIKLRMATNKARICSEVARLELERHKLKHPR
jgi:hypothetical protein